MEIVNFFETLAGKWFSQRTTHYLGSQESRAGQSNLQIDFLQAEDPALVSMATEHQPLCGLRIQQDSRMEGDTESIQRSSLLVILSGDQADQGQVLISQGVAEPLSGQYALENEVLTLQTPAPEGQVEERLWFVNPNLRMRTSVVKVGDMVQLTSFCSEIRMGVAPPKS